MFGDGTLTVRDGELQLSLVAQTAQSRATLNSNFTYDLRDSSIAVEVLQVAGNVTEISLRDPSDASVFMGVQSGELFAFSKGRSLARRAYAAAADRFWRLRADGASLVWETSPDATTWSELARDAVPLDLAWVSLGVSAFTEGATAPAGVARIGSINPSSSSEVAWCPLKAWDDSLGDGRFAPQLGAYADRCNIVEQGGQAVLTVTQQRGYCEVYATRPSDARGGAVAMEVLPAASPLTTGLRLVDSSSRNEILMQVSDTMRFLVKADNVEVLNASAARDPGSQRYWRITLSAPNVAFEVSPDAVTWQTLASASAPALDASELRLERFIYGPDDAAVPATATFGAKLR
jgi:hypothetical protein